jgi:endonuclease G
MSAKKSVRKRRPASAKKAARPARKPQAKRKRAVTVEALRDYVRGHYETYLEDPNITSVGVGRKIRNGKRSNELAIQFTVRKKVKDTEIEAIGSTKIPDSVTVDGHTVPTDVLEREYRPCYKLRQPETKSARKQRLDVLVPGISVSHPKGSAGTLGLMVYDRRDGSRYMLSNWHVLNTPSGHLGDTVVQPGPYDDDRVDQNGAGVLVRSHLGVAADAAIARIEGRGIDPTVLDLKIVPRRIAEAALGDRVVKSGRTSDVTYGVVRRVHVVTKIDYEGSVGEVAIGGFEIGPDPERLPSDGEVSMGGDSGAAWLIAGKKGGATDIFVGLHFAGEAAGSDDEHAVACYAHAVLEKLEVGLAPAGEKVAEAEAAAVGFDEAFLGVEVALPEMTETVRKDAVVVGHSTVIRHTHFSLTTSKSRRMARFVAWNIDGARLRKYGRTGLQFLFDPRVPEKWQFGDDLYSDNKLDRGHIARRADLVWGAAAEAKRANADSFFFTNITPQHQAFNQSMRHGLWGMLEDALFEDIDVDNLRVSMMGGPIFKDADRAYRGARVPSDFWKVLAYVDAADSQLKAKAYVLTQDNLLDNIEAFELDPFRLYQVSISELEQRTGLRFSSVRAHDQFVTGELTEALSTTGRRRAVREVMSRADLIIPVA